VGEHGKSLIFCQYSFDLDLNAAFDEFGSGIFQVQRVRFYSEGWAKSYFKAFGRLLCSRQPKAKKELA
jgi:hypothetical protein